MRRKRHRTRDGFGTSRPQRGYSPTKQPTRRERQRVRSVIVVLLKGCTRRRRCVVKEDGGGEKDTFLLPLQLKNLGGTLVRGTRDGWPESALGHSQTRKLQRLFRRANCAAEFLGNPETMLPGGSPKMGPTHTPQVYITLDGI